MGKILLVVLVFAGLVYGFFWLMERRRLRGTSPRPATPQRRVVAPDDDEDFLRELERRRRRASRETKPEKPAPRPEREATDRTEPEQDQPKPKPEGPADKGRSKPE